MELDTLLGLASWKLLQSEVAKGLNTFDDWLWKEKKRSKSWTIVLTVSSGFDCMFENWYHWYTKLNLNLEVIVLAKDRNTFERYRSMEGVSTFLSPNISEAAHAFTYESHGYNKLVSTRARDLLYVLQYRDRVLYTDIDTVWLKDPTAFLREEFDIAASLDDWKDNRPYYCTGFLAIKDTAATRELLKKWNQVLTTRPQLNQPAFNRAIIEQGPNILQLPLSRTHFPIWKFVFRPTASEAYCR